MLFLLELIVELMSVWLMFFVGIYEYFVFEIIKGGILCGMVFVG